MQNAEMRSEWTSVASPIIGVLCIDSANLLIKLYGEEIESYIPSAVVKYLESSGARVLPIWNNKDVHYYEDIMNKINGIVLPGGNVFINPPQDCAPELTNYCVASSKIVYDIAKRKNDSGEFFPLFGICLGFQLLVLNSAPDEFIQSSKGEIRKNCEHMRCELPFKFSPDFEHSRLFTHLNQNLKKQMESRPIGCHRHQFCITEEDLHKFGVANPPQWRSLATNEDSKGLQMITVIEHTKYPFYGTQIHPESVAYENCIHTAEDLPHCIEGMRYFADFFVAECRKNSNRFGTCLEELRHLIWNFPQTFTCANGSFFRQCFLFSKCPQYPIEPNGSKFTIRTNDEL